MENIKNENRIKNWLPILLLFFFAYGIYDTLYFTGNNLFSLFKETINNPTQIRETRFSLQNWKIISTCITLFLFIFIGLLGYYSFKKSYINSSDKVKFFKIFYSHFFSFIIGNYLSFFLFFIIGCITYILGMKYSFGYNYFINIEMFITTNIESKTPTIFQLPYIIALFLSLIIGGLPYYLIHWLSHNYRFLWYAMHRCHHTAEVLHPMAVGPFYFFPKVFAFIPTLIIPIIFTKILYYKPLFYEVLILQFFYVIMRQFDHSTPFYDITNKNKLLKFLANFYGAGAYHYMHHSSKPSDESINLGGGLFLFWDRVFGTFKNPYLLQPKVGLTNNPEIELSPIKLIFSGIEKIIYELKMNKNLKTRYNILFGSIWYQPPITKDSLIVKHV